jgi:hypothetical protein
VKKRAEAARGRTPEVLARAVLGSCLAIGYVISAAMPDVPLVGVERVERVW